MPTGIVFEHDGCCDNFTVRSNFDCPIGGPAVRNFSASGLTIGETYLIHIDGNANSEFDLEVTNNIAGNPLPVELIAFSGQNKGDHNMLTWITASELNSDYFVVERSTGDGEWIDIGRVDALGRSASSQTYELLDKTPPEGMGYYRLRQIDADGSSQYSKVVALKNFYEDNQLMVSRIYPNPSQDLVYMDISSLAQEAELNMELRDASGRLMMANTQLVTRGDNQVAINIAALAPGMYTCIIRTDEEIVDITRLIRN